MRDYVSVSPPRKPHAHRFSLRSAVFEQQRESRGWSTLESVYRSFVEPDAPTKSKPLNFVPRLSKLAESAQAGLAGADQILRTRSAQKAPEKAEEILGSVGKIGVAAQVADRPHRYTWQR